jgi:hypothetical protein
MTAEEIISVVESVGGTLRAEGDKIRVKSPVQISPDIKDAIRAHKPKLLQVLCPHASGCPHSPDELIVEFERTGKLRVEFEGRSVYLVRTREIAETITDGTVYTLSEWTRIAGLPVGQIRRDHRLSTMSGRSGSIQVKDRE